MAIALGVGGLVVTILAVFLAAYLAARGVARTCMRAEHRTLREQLSALTVKVAIAEQRNGDAFTDMARRLDRLERAAGSWGSRPVT